MKSTSQGLRVRVCISGRSGTRGGGAGGVKPEKSEPGRGTDLESAGHWHWGQRAHLGSHWAGGSTFTLMEQNGSELSLVPDPLGPRETPRLHLPSLQSHPQLLSVLCHPKGRQIGEVP